MPNSNNNQSSGSGLKTAATFGLGALLGAVAAGAAWYLSGEEESQQQRNQPHRYYQANHPVNQGALVSRQESDDKEKDEKDGTVKMCEICFVAFDELKQCGVQIMSTPCGHVYCRDCIVGSLTVKPECPHCRTEVHESQLRRLYL